jgi:hypothetical protein
MVKKFTTNCDFSGKKYPVTFFIGDPMVGVHPLAFQSSLLSKEKGGNIPNDIMESFSKLKDIADRNNVSFEELCSFVIDEINAKNNLLEDYNAATEISKSDKK